MSQRAISLGEDMADSLQDQVAIVTGGALGIGGATARRLAAEGARVLIADINLEAAEENAGRIRDAGGTVEVLETDVSRGEAIQGMVAQAVALWGRLDVLVNNAWGVMVARDGSALELSEDAWDYAMDTMVKAIFLGAKYAVPEMERSGGGNIVNIASVHGQLMAPGHLAYEAAKSSVIGVTRQMATDFGPVGIRVNAICPGHIVTEKLEQHWKKNPSLFRFFEAQYPVGRTGKPVDIANAVRFLCSEEASFITGHALVVDGGLTIQLQENLGVKLGKFLRENPDVELS